ncbi:MAG: hypothetical protein WAT79_17385 [Saprospiraceae bacterium]
MYTIDLQKLGKRKIDQFILEKVGSAPIFKGGIKKLRGVTGFYFEDEISGTRLMYNVNIALFEKGLGLYCRNRHYNFLVLIPFAEIGHINLSKRVDELQIKSFSWFTLASKFGLTYWKSKNYLLESEIIALYPLVAIIAMEDGKSITLKSESSNIDRAILFFKTLPWEGFLKVKIETYTQ